MKIHLISEHASPLALLGGVDAGGQNVHVAALAAGLARRGAAVVVHTRRDDPALPRRVEFCPGVVIDHVDAGPPEPIPKDRLLSHMDEFRDDLVDQWRDDRPDVAHAHFWMSGLASLQAGRQLDVPVALTYHALGVDKRRHQGSADTSPSERTAIEQWLAQSVDLVIATTALECRTLTSMGADARRITVIPCGVDLERFRPDGEHWPARSALRRVVSVSRLVPRKGLADVVEAVAGIADAELLIAGGPPAALLDDDEHARDLRELAASLGAAERVHLLGAVDHARIPSLLRSADVVCCAPWYEPFGLVAVEAMACGTPVVASAVGGLAETVDDGVTGILVPPRRPRSVRAAIEAVTGERGNPVARRQASIRRASHYGWDEIARRTMAAFDRVAPRPAESTPTPPSTVRTVSGSLGWSLR
jgi:D-inositol-3-phosphate glycosyltransferase